MATIVEFPQCNFVWKGWNGPGGEPEVLDLPCYVQAVSYQDPGLTISCWELTEIEREEVARTGKVWLQVIGPGHPPILVRGDNPFAPEKLN